MPQRTANAASEILAKVVCAIVEQPEKVRVQATVADRSITLTLEVAQKDFLALTDHNGRTQRSLRVVVGSLAKRSGLDISLDIQQLST